MKHNFSRGFIVLLLGLLPLPVLCQAATPVPPSVVDKEVFREVRPDNSDTIIEKEKLDKIWQLYNEADECGSKKEFDKAEDCLKDAVRLSTELQANSDASIPSLSRLGGFYCRMGRWADAERVYSMVPRTAPSDRLFSLDNILAEILMKQGKYAEARIVLGEYIGKVKRPKREAVKGQYCDFAGGNADLEYNKFLSMYSTCLHETSNITKKQLEQLRRTRRLNSAKMQEFANDK